MYCRCPNFRAAPIFAGQPFSRILVLANFANSSVSEKTRKVRKIEVFTVPNAQTVLLSNDCDWPDVLAEKEERYSDEAICLHVGCDSPSLQTDRV